RGAAEREGSRHEVSDALDRSERTAPAGPDAPDQRRRGEEGSPRPSPAVGAIRSPGAKTEDDVRASEKGTLDLPISAAGAGRLHQPHELLRVAAASLFAGARARLPSWAAARPRVRAPDTHPQYRPGNGDSGNKRPFREGSPKGRSRTSQSLAL